MEKRCGYCAKELSEEWDSEWSGSIHYKVNSCSCGKKHWLIVDFLGSGHDRMMVDEESIDTVLEKGSDTDYAK